MHVFRVQDKKGRGPFAPGLSSKWCEIRPDHDNLQPFFIQWPDFVAGKDSNFGCACTSIEQLKRWFTQSEYTTLKKLGFQAVKLQVDAIVRESDIQCIFKRNRALRKGAEPIQFY